MGLYRKEVSDFIRLGETLLSPVSLGQPLTQDECRVVDFYVSALAGRYASQGQTLVDQTELVLKDSRSRVEGRGKCTHLLRLPHLPH